MTTREGYDDNDQEKDDAMETDKYNALMAEMEKRLEFAKKAEAPLTWHPSPLGVFPSDYVKPNPWSEINLPNTGEKPLRMENEATQVFSLKQKAAELEVKIAQKQEENRLLRLENNALKAMNAGLEKAIIELGKTAKG